VADHAAGNARPQVRALAQHGVGSRRELAAAWARKPGLLQQELAMWLPRGKQPLLAQLWPELQREAAAAAAAAPAAAGRRQGGAGKKGGVRKKGGGRA
jgi:hypothetical protein